MPTRSTALLRAICGTIVVAALLVMGLLPMEAHAQTGLVVRGISAYGLDGWSGDMRLGHVTFSVQNNTTQSVTFTTWGETYLPDGYEDEFGNWVNGPLMGTSSAAITLAAGQSASVVFKLDFLSEGASDDIVLHLANSSGVPVFNGRANVSGSYYGMTASFYGETSTPVFTPKPKSVTVTATTTAIAVELWNQGDTYLTATYALATNCAAVGVTCSVPATVQANPLRSVTVPITFSRGSYGAALPTFKVYATAPINRYGVVERDSVSVTISFGDIAAPSIWIEPSSGVNPETGEPQPPLVTTRTTPVYVSACDSDGSLGALAVMLNGVAVTPTNVATGVYPCSTSKRGTFVLPWASGTNTLVASVSDGVHTSSATQTIVYDDAADHTPVVTALHAAPAAPINRPVTDTFLVRNPGWHAVQYTSMSSSSFCAWENPTGGYCGGLSLQDTITVAAGATANVPITYGSPSTQGKSERVTLRAQYASSFSAVYGAGSFLATALPVVAPTVIVSPSNSPVVSTPTVTLTVTWCDDDDSVVQRSVSLNGQDLGAGSDPGVGPTPNCLHEVRRRWTNVGLAPWQPSVVAAVGVDEQGHSTTGTSTITFAPSLSAFQPDVTPATRPIRTVRPRIAGADTFTVRNAGQYAATYVLTPTCGAPGSCTVDHASLALAAGVSGTAVVSYLTPATLDLPDTITLVARYAPPNGFAGVIADTGTTTVVAPSIEIAPIISAPIGASVLFPTWVGTWAFPIVNHNSAPVTFLLDWSATGGFWFPNWFTPPTTLTVGAGQTEYATIYTKAPSGDGVSGTYTLMASYTTTNGTTLSASAVAQNITQVPHAAMALSPKNTTLMVTPGTSPYQTTFSVSSSGNTSLIVVPSIHCSGLVVNCRFHASPQYNLAINPTESANVLVDFDLASNATVGSLTLVAVDGQTLGASPDSATVSVRRDGPFVALAVTPKTAYGVGLNRIVTQRFDVTNTGNTASTVILSVRCTGTAVGCASRDTTRTLNPSETASVTVTAFTAMNPALNGSMLLIATATSPNTAIDTGRANVTTESVAEVVVSTRRANAGVNTARERCLTISAGDDAAYECGDLRLVHALPSTTTMNKARTPTLVYESRHQRGLALFAADVSIAPGDTARSITAHVVIDGISRVDRTFSWNPQWNTGNPRRIAVPIDAYALGISTGAHHYTFSVDAQSAQASAAGQDSGTVAVINRATSPFGAGWWLDGLELLIPYTATEKLWIGGDGSTRLFKQQPSGTWSVTQPMDRVETLTTDGASWYRQLPNGAYVQFDNAGRHIATVNAAGHRTSFAYNSSTGRLSRIDLPVGSTTQRSYVFNYDANGILASVDAPAGPNGSRLVQINHSTTWNVSSIRDPGLGSADSVRFSYDSYGRISTRINRRGDATYYRYDEATHVLLGDSISMQRTGELPIVTAFCPAEAASLVSCAAGPQDTATVKTWVDGPRRDVNDTTRFHLTPLGAPDRITNALGQVTTIEHGDSRWPALATAVISSNGHRVESYYSARGLVDSTIDRKPFGDDRNALTTYQWDGTFDKPLVITTPGSQTRFGYFPNGDRQWQEDGRGASSRVWFTYNANRQLETILTPDNQATQQKEHLSYDPTLGNLSQTTTALGFVTDYFRDVLGRDTLVVTPTDAAQTSQFKQQTRTTYDVLDRVRMVSSSALSGYLGSPMQTLNVASDYDEEGNLTRVTRTVDPDPLNLTTMTIESVYDAAGRKIREHDPERGVTITEWHYDVAGNVTSTSRGGDAPVTVEYDELNRMKRRLVPGIATASSTTLLTDDQNFSYDSSGNLAGATNFAARIGRTYYPNGSLATDTLRIASANLAESDTTRFKRHAYVLQYTYDVAGRRKTMTPPAGFGLAPVTYDYYDEMGALRQVSDGAFGAFRYFYTNGGLLDSLQQADGTGEKHHYDADGRETSRTERNSISGILHDDFAGLDARGKKLSVTSSGAAGLGGDFYTYDGLGGATSTRGRTTETTPRDALGNTISHTRSGEDYDEFYRYLPHTTQLRFVTHQLDATNVADSLEQSYSLSGDLVRTQERISGPMLCQSAGGYTPCPSGGQRRTIAWSNLTNAYDASGRLTYAVKETSNDNSPLWLSPRDPNDISVYEKFERGVAEEFRYDALGRRVWVRAHRNAYCPGIHDRDSTSICISTIERSVYDGDQVLIEIRQPGDDDASVSTLESDGPATGTPVQHFGTVGYLHGPTIDHPLALVRNYDSSPTPVVLHYSWAHGLDLSTRLNGDVLAPCLSALCGSDQPDWVGRRMTYGFVIPSVSLGPVSWWGTMANMKQNATGGLDMRARVYDSRTGRFTQEDPIGLVGGANLYGFASGDPVNFSDPFGLCPELPQLCLPAIAAAGRAVGAAVRSPAGQRLIERGSMLARNLAASGKLREAGEAAHHIVAKAAAAAQPAREVMQRYGVEIDEEVNGVFLPAARDYAGQAINHLTVHTQRYYQAVNEFLSAAESKIEVQEALRAIRDRLLKGEFPR